MAPLVLVVLLALAGLALPAPASAGNVFSSGRYKGDGTYYGYRARGAGHCSFHFVGLGASSPGFLGTPLAINAPQYADGNSVCGLCVRFRGTGSGSGGSPIGGDWQPGFIW